MEAMKERLRRARPVQTMVVEVVGGRFDGLRLTLAVTEPGTRLLRVKSQEYALPPVLRASDVEAAPEA